MTSSNLIGCSIGEIGRFRPLQDSVHIGSSPLVVFCVAVAIVEENAGLNELVARAGQRRQAMFGREFHDAFDIGTCDPKRVHIECLGALACDCSEGRIQVRGAPHVNTLELQPQRVSGGALLRRLTRLGLVREIQHNCQSRSAWHDLLEHLEALRDLLRTHDGGARDVPSGSRQSRDQPAPDRIGHT